MKMEKTFVEYTHKFNGITRNYRLQDDKIHIGYGSMGGSKGEATFNLSIVNQNYTRSFERSQLFSAVLLLAILLSIMTIVTVGFSLVGYVQFSWLIALYPVVAIALLVGSGRRTESYTFRNHDGVVLFSVTRDRKRHVEFDAFIGALLEKVKACDPTIKS